MIYLPDYFVPKIWSNFIVSILFLIILVVIIKYRYGIIEEIFPKRRNKRMKDMVSSPIIIGEYSDAVTVLFDYATKCALVVYNRDPNDEERVMWAYTKVLDIVEGYDKDHLFFINMANEDFYIRYLNNRFLKLNENQSKILKGYPTNCEEIMNALFLINYNGISAGFEGQFLCKSE